ncbi:hypothetical protein [Paenibacillus sp. HB172176]|uniref:LiaF transmembrane domain-containing protein n=1 Tax=Paenibacillus sp. HB172176 TaxID=2493690 RepID=UPI00143C97E5|nr:hypothetical protein [Paenibacillus sp. HB172176]
MNGKTVLGAGLVLIGALVVLRIFNIHVGSIFGALLPFILIGFGIVGWRNNKKLIGGILIVIGALSLLKFLSGIIVLAVAIALIIGGVSMLKKNNRGSY